MAKSKSVSIRFKQQAYRLMKNYPFKPAYVFSEYIDNSIQSFNDNKVELLKINKKAYLHIKINISIEDDTIEIIDNAAGISDSKMETAFEPGSLPENNKGLNEFGIGLKNASVWMSDLYTVETSALGENYSKTVNFDYHKVIKEEIEDLIINYKNIEPQKSFTRIVLKKLRSDVNKFNFIQIGKELGSIYRGMLNSGELKITFQGNELFYNQPEFLESSYYPDFLKYKNGEIVIPPKIKWRFDFDIKFNDKRMFGFVGILKKMQKNENGISYCRRGRVIEGSGDEKMFPASICSGDPSSHQRKRIFGEFNFDGFEVSTEKGKILAEEDVESLIDLLSMQLKHFRPEEKSNSYDFLRQAKELRVEEDIVEKDIIDKLKKKQNDFNKLNNSNENKDQEKEKFKRILDKIDVTKKPKENKLVEIQIPDDESIERIIPGLNNEKYLIRYTVKKDILNDVLYEIQIKDVKDRGEKNLLNEGIVKIIEGYINLACPFLIKYDHLIKGKASEGFFEFIQNLMVAEAISQIKGVTNAHYQRDTLNELINT